VRGSSTTVAGRSNTGTVNFGSRAYGGAPIADKNVWIHLVQYLKKAELLPVVVFTFSKKRCEDNASGLSGQDLTTASQKSEVHITIEKALTRLKGELDREISFPDAADARF
jgi:antiviral helicase SKI2